MEARQKEAEKTMLGGLGGGGRVAERDKRENEAAKEV